MEKEKSQNRIRSALARIYEEHPPKLKELHNRFKQNPKSRLFAPLAEAFRRQGKIEEAIQLCAEGLVHHPDFHSGRVALAKCLMDQQDWEEAKKQLEMVVEAVPDNLLAQKLLGRCHLKMGNRAAALQEFDKAIMLAPEDVDLAAQVKALEPKIPVVDSDSEEVVVKSVGEDFGDDVEEVTGSLTSTELPSLEGKTVNSEPTLVPSVSADGRIEMVPFNPEEETGALDRVLGFSEEDDEPDGFRVEHVSDIFQEEDEKSEITTETLGDLYFSQGQYDKSLKIFEKLAGCQSSPVLTKKIESCRIRLGVNSENLVRERKIQALHGLLQRVQHNAG